MTTCRIYRLSKSSIRCAALMGAACLIGLLLVLKPSLGMAIGILPFVLWLGITEKKNLLFLFLLLLPYHTSPLLAENLMGITGAKPFNLIAAFLLLMLFFHHGALFRTEDALEKRAVWFFCVYLSLFAFTVIRSIDHLPLLNMISPENFHRSSVNHLLTFFIRPALFTMSFVYVLKHIKTGKEINRCIDMICIAIFLLSWMVLFISIANIDKITISRIYVRDAISFFFNVHYNAIGSIYIACTPLLALRALTGRPFPLINYALAGIAVLLLQSRSTIAVFLGGTILLLYCLKNWKAMAFFACILVLFFLFWLPEFLERVLLIGFDTGDPNAIFTGRIDKIWLPLITERLRDPSALLFGRGLYSILISNAYLSREIFQVNTAHNAFLALFLDCGLIVFSLFVFYLTVFLKKAWSLAKKADTSTGWALFTCLITYLVGTISGRDFFPSRHNMYMFPIIALLINYFRLHLSAGKYKEAPFPNGD
ncbi:O-antigen ligase family protein [Desulfosudis oleivorans]|uniref:O-antigen ligase-related domain-containing protein n=1 Tax=Desulfosudis oleivorans (strain DSM 6200 / JCM 39069 / Hxd3) TaxID=96561 RepID=A9A0Y0_DESOH|nr:O-antigen ligase family protein [Desulfosudis oleivorans]ABW67605.1 hypothetical protein Dole_1801 [Desulfosudis oleivorans Hxd3]